MSEASAFSDGQIYERMMGRWSRLVGDQFLDWLALPKGLRWLDVGCGNGAFTEALIAHGAPAEVIGIDPSEGQLAYARARPGAKLAKFRVGGAQALPFPDNSFDVVTMALAITFVPDPLKAVAEMARVVRPGGMVATYMWDIPGGGLPLHPIYAAMKSLDIDFPVPPGVEASTLENMRSYWQKTGQQSVETRVIRIRVAYSGFDDIWDSNSVPGGGPIGQVINRMTPEMKERLKARLRMQLTPAADGTIAYEAYANAAKGIVAG